MYIFINFGGKLTWKKNTNWWYYEYIVWLMVNQIGKGDFSSIYSSSRFAQSIWTGPGSSLCSLSGLSLPSRPNSLFLLEPFTNKIKNLSLRPAQTVSTKHGPLPGQLAVCRHRTITPNPDLVNPESVMEASWSARAINWSLCYFVQLFPFSTFTVKIYSDLGKP